MMRFVFRWVSVVLVLASTLTGCTSLAMSNGLLQYKEHDCAIEVDTCGIRWNDESSVHYSVSPKAGGRYLVTGKVDYNQEKGVTNSRFVEFYLVFKSKEKIVYKRHIKTYIIDNGFEFEFDSSDEVQTSSILNFRFLARS